MIKTRQLCLSCHRDNYDLLKLMHVLQELNTSIRPLRDVSHYYFDGQGKYIRPMIVLLTAVACNNHTSNTRLVHSTCTVFEIISPGVLAACCIYWLNRGTSNYKGLEGAPVFLLKYKIISSHFQCYV